MMARRRHIERDAAISRAVAAGIAVSVIAGDWGLAVSTVYGITRREGWTWHRGPAQIPRFCVLPGCVRRVPRASGRYCSHDCFVAARRLHLPRCANCLEPVKRSSSKFCSRACYHACARRYWSAANGDRDHRIIREAATGTPQTRLAARHGIHPRTVSNVLARSPDDRPDTCLAPRCSEPLPRKHRRFCSRRCRAACLLARSHARDTWIFFAAALRIPQREIALTTGLGRSRVAGIIRRQQRPLLPGPAAERTGFRGWPDLWGDA